MCRRIVPYATFYQLKQKALFDGIYFGKPRLNILISDWIFLNQLADQ